MKVFIKEEDNIAGGFRVIDLANLQEKHGEEVMLYHAYLEADRLCQEAKRAWLESLKAVRSAIKMNWVPDVK